MSRRGRIVMWGAWSVVWLAFATWNLITCIRGDHLGSWAIGTSGGVLLVLAYNLTRLRRRRRVRRWWDAFGHAWTLIAVHYAADNIDATCESLDRALRADLRASTERSAPT